MDAEGDLRIVDRMEGNGYVSGALQVFIGGAFGAVCASSFDPVDADVACKQLGFLGGTALPLAVDRRGRIPTLPVRLPLHTVFHKQCMEPQNTLSVICIVVTKD